MNSLRMLVPPDQKPSAVNTCNSLEFIRACEAEQSVSRVREGTSALSGSIGVFQKSGAETPWNASVICETYLPKLADRKSPYERRILELYMMVQSGMFCDPISRKDNSRLHQFGLKMLPGTFHRIRIEFWRRLDWRLDQTRIGNDMENNVASEVHVQKVHVQRSWNQELAVSLFLYLHVLTQDSSQRREGHAQSQTFTPRES